MHVDSGRLSFLPVYLSTLSRLDALDCEVAVVLRCELGRGGRRRVNPPLRTFFRLEKKRATDRYISALRASDGSLVMDEDRLCNLLWSLYLNLFLLLCSL